MGTTLAQVLQHFGPQHLSEHGLSTPRAKAWRAIVAFMRRVAALEINTCPHCKTGRLRLVQLLAPLRSPMPETHRATTCRGPP